MLPTNSKKQRLEVFQDETGNNNSSSNSAATVEFIRPSVPPSMPRETGGSSSEHGSSIPEMSDQTYQTALNDLHMRHTSLCHTLNLDNESIKRSESMIQGYLSAIATSPQEKKQVIMCGPCFCAISIWTSCYLASKEGSNNQSGISLTQVIFTTQVIPADFFHRAPIFLQKCTTSLTPELIQHLLYELGICKTEYNFMTTASSKMKELFSGLFKPTSRDLNACRLEEAFLGECLRFAWLLYLYVKEKLIPAENRSSKIYWTALVCSVRFTFKHIPQSLHRPICEAVRKLGLQLDGINYDPKQPWTVVYDLAFAQILMKVENPDYLDFQQSEKTFLHFVELSFINNNKWSFSEYKNGLLVDVFNVQNMTGLQKSCEATMKEYQFVQKMNGSSLDGRYFMSKKTLGGITPKKLVFTPGTTAGKTPAARSLRVQLMKASALNTSMMSTPLSAKGLNGKRSLDDNYTTGERLKLHLQNQPEGPSQILLGYFALCKPDPTAVVQERVKKAFDKICEAAPSAHETWILAVKYYYHVLEVMIRGEDKQGVPPNQISDTLNDPAVHRAFLCCSFELFRFIFKISCIEFDFLVKFLEVKLFTFCMVIELVIKYDGQMLNWNVIKRLKELEERILESEIWKSDDPLYNLLNQEAQENANDPFALNSPRKALEYFKTKCAPFGEVSKENGGLSSQSGLNKTATTSLEIFYRKLYRLLSSRLANLCNALQLNDSVRDKTWTALVEGLLVEKDLRVFYKRHMDQVIICAIYALTKVTGIDMRMTDIIMKYRSQPQSLTDIQCHVHLFESRTGDLIDFYNQIFIVKMKRILYPTNTVQSNPTGLESLPNQQSVLMSPMRPRGIGGAMMTPITKKLRNPGEILPLSAATSRPHGVRRVNLKH